VAANSQLRDDILSVASEVKVPPRQLCTDNAAMIAAAALGSTAAPLEDFAALDAYPSGQPAPV
jgi:N6-L-threonylcarbamoyladenine synthase